MEHKLVAYYEQLLDASERKEVEQWLQEDPAHEHTYKKTIRAWQESGMDRDYTLYNKERAWEKIREQIDSAADQPRLQGRILRIKWWRAGAVAASIAGLAFVLFMISRPRSLEFTAESGIRNIQLKDKSSIVLYPHARLEVDKDFNQKERRVMLKGDARFDIARDPGKPFIIRSNDVEVQVLGTAFTIQQRADFNTVFVHSGKVRATLGDQTVTAIARQKIVKDNRTNQLFLRDIHTAIDDVLKTQTIRCNNMRIDSLVNILKELYNVDIRFDPAIGSKRITSTYLSYESPEQVMENIALMINATWQKKEDHYIITK